MKTRILYILGLCLVLVHCSESAIAAADQQASQLLHHALTQMGGEDKLKALRTVRFRAAGYRNALEQSERPEGPYIVEYDQVTESRDLAHGRWKQETEMNWQMQPVVKEATIVADGAASRSFDNQPAPASHYQLQQAEEELELGPEHVLLTALAATDLHLEADTVLQSVPQQVVAFTWKTAPVRIFLNRYTSLPTAVEWTRAYPSDTFSSVWGDTTTRVYYSLWWLYPGGIHYPRQWDKFRNNLPDRVLTISELTLNPEFPADEFAIAPSVLQDFAKRQNNTADDRPLGLPSQPAVELAKDVIHIPGAWNTTLVKQTDG